MNRNFAVPWLKSCPGDGERADWKSRREELSVLGMVGPDWPRSKCHKVPPSEWDVTFRADAPVQLLAVNCPTED